MTSDIQYVTDLVPEQSFEVWFRQYFVSEALKCELGSVGTSILSSLFFASNVSYLYVYFAFSYCILHLDNLDIN